MGDKYWMFRELLDFMADRGDVTFATTQNYSGNIEICCDTGDTVIKMDVRVINKEDEKND